MAEPSPKPSASRPVFVVGAMRSGTTLLRLMLNRSPDITIPAESHFLARLVRSVPAGVALSEDQRRHALAVIEANPEWRRDFTTTDAELEAALGSDPVTTADIIDRVFRLEIAPTGKARWGDKTPAYLFSVERILEHLPDAQFVAIVRDPRDAYLSLVKYDWVDTTTWAIGLYLQKCGSRVNTCARTLRPDQFIVVRYEDLVLATETTLVQLCGDLDLTYDEQMLSFFEAADDHVQSWEFEIGAHTKLRRAVEPSDVERWRREGDHARIREIEALTPQVVRRHGYERTVPDRSVRVLQIRARLRHEWEARRPSRSRRG
jgi:hypothetical protein